MDNAELRKSFTLIELLIVIIIIGVIVTLAAPQYQIFIINSKGAEAKNNLKALSNSILRYHLEAGRFPNEGIMPAILPSFLDISLINPSKDFIYSYGGDKPPDFPGMSDGNYVNSIHAGMRHPYFLNAPVNSIVGYEIIYLLVASYDDTPGQKIQEGLYLYYRHGVKTATGTIEYKWGW